MGKFFGYLVNYTEDVYKVWEKGGIGKQVLEWRADYEASLNKSESSNKADVSIKQGKSIKKLNDLRETN
jgi:hypothetical protein